MYSGKNREDSNVYFALLVWVAVASLLSYVIEQLWIGAVSRRTFRLAVAPGVIVHELSHVVGCLITGAVVRRVVLFGKSGGSVTHTKPKVPVVGEPIISLAPIAGCTVALGCVWWIFSGRLGLQPARLPGVEFSAMGALDFPLVLGGLFGDAIRLLLNWKLLSIEGLIFLYLVLTFSVGMAPSGTDLRHSLTGLAFVGALAFLIHLTGFDSLQTAASASDRILRFWWEVFTFSILLLMIALAVTVPAAVIHRLSEAK